MVEEDFQPVDLSVVDQSYLTGCVKVEASTWLEHEDHRISHYISSLRTAQNSLLPIWHLSDDVLASIIYLAVGPPVCKSYELEVRLDVERPPKPWKWTKVTHVCRRCRRIALQQVSLWSCIDSEDLRRARTFLKRFHRTTLHVDLGPFVDGSWPFVTRDMTSSRNPGHLEHLSTIHPHADRVSELSVELSGSNLEEILRLLTFPLPWFQELSLRVRPRWHRTPFEMSIRRFETGIAMMELGLQRLSLCSVVIPFSSPIYQGLRVLELKDQYRDKENPTSLPLIEDIFSVLEGCPYLEDLVLETAVSKLHQSTTTNSTTHFSNLPYLSTMDH